MKLLSIAAIMFLWENATGQTKLKKYHIDKIGMTIYVPGGFKIEVPEPNPVYKGADFKPITDPEELKRLAMVNPLQLLRIKTKDGLNKVSIQLDTISDYFLEVVKLVSDTSLPDSIQYLSMLKKMSIAIARQSSNKFDTLFSKVIIDNITFDKLFTNTKVRGQDNFEGLYSAKFGRYYLQIPMFFIGSTIGDKLMRTIETAKFH